MWGPGSAAAYLGCDRGWGHAGSCSFLSAGAWGAPAGRARLRVPEELHSVLPPLQGGGLLVGAGLGPVLQGGAGGSGAPSVLLPITKGPLTVAAGPCGPSGSQSWPRTKCGGCCDPSAPTGAGAGQQVPGGRDVRVRGVAAVVTRGLILQGAGCAPQLWWGLGPPCARSRWGH